MRDRKELLYCNIKDLTETEIQNLGNLELNSCDRCGEIDISEQLYWLEYFYEGEEKIPKKLLNKQGELKWTALCGGCHSELTGK